MSYDKDLVFLDLEWLTYKKKNYITQIGIVRLDKKYLSLKKQRLFKIKNNHFNNFQLGLIGAKSNHDKGTVTLNKKVIHEIFELLNNSIIHIYFDPKDVEHDDVTLLLNTIKFDNELSYELVKIYTKWSLRHLYANYKKQNYVSNMFHNALDDVKMLQEIYLNNIGEINQNIPFYEYTCNYELYGIYATNKSTYKKICPNNPKIVYKMSDLWMEQGPSIKFSQQNIFFHTYQYCFRLTNVKTKRAYTITNENIYNFIELIPNMLLIRDKVSTNKLEKILQTIFVENNYFLVLLTTNLKSH